MSHKKNTSDDSNSDSLLDKSVDSGFGGNGGGGGGGAGIGGGSGGVGSAIRNGAGRFILFIKWRTCRGDEFLPCIVFKDE